MLGTPILAQLCATTWQVVIGNDMLVGYVGIYPYQLQLAMWRVVAQNCAKIGVPSISLKEINIDKNLMIYLILTVICSFMLIVPLR